MGHLGSFLLPLAKYLIGEARKDPRTFQPLASSLFFCLGNVVTKGRSCVKTLAVPGHIQEPIPSLSLSSPPWHPRDFSWGSISQRGGSRNLAECTSACRAMGCCTAGLLRPAPSPLRQVKVPKTASCPSPETAGASTDALGRSNRAERKCIVLTVLSSSLEEWSVCLVRRKGHRFHRRFRNYATGNG